jgi:predicted nucleotidyltransferase component of viral defense system
MSKAEPGIRLHEDLDLFREAVRFTATETGFPPRLIEKDYFCTLLLAYLSGAAGGDLVFKGGTCLAKVHAELYRLSEDLDYTIPVPMDAPRKERSNRAANVKTALNGLAKAIPTFQVVDPLRGANKSTQYLAVVGYGSTLSQQKETIKIEVSLREPLLMPTVNGSARTLLLNPVTARDFVQSISLRCIENSEALAEKFRAALSRREVAVRDFYDIDYAVRNDGLNPEDAKLVEQVRQKLAIPGNEPVDVSERRLSILRRQVESQLKPVLREKEFAGFDLDRAFKMVFEMATAVG